MRYIKVLLILIMFFIGCNCYALTVEQQENITTYIKELITKGNKRTASDGTVLLKYGSGSTRLPAFRDELYNGHFVFNCDSLMSYVLSHTYGIPVIKSSGTPWTVQNYYDSSWRDNDITTTIVGKGNYKTIKSKLVKGDLILAYNYDDPVHIFMYVGDGYIAQSRNRGLFVETFDSYAPNYYDYRVIRIRDDVATKPLDMSIIWPDTHEKEILGKTIDPVIKISYDNSKISSKGTISVVLTDDHNLTGYFVSKTIVTSNYPWINLNAKTYDFNYDIMENGTYYVYTKDNSNQIVYKSINITNIDNKQPVINDIKCTYNDNGTVNITIIATDTSALKYSIDSVIYQSNNVFEKVSLGEYKISVIDEASNVSSTVLKIEPQSKPTINITYDKSFKKELDININIYGNDITGYNVTTSSSVPKSWLSYNNNLTYHITQNGTYYIWGINDKKLYEFQKIVISNIDNKKPIISSITKKNCGNGKCDIIINAQDNQSGIQGYSLNGKSYQVDNYMNSVSYGTIKIYVKDNCDNILEYKYTFDYKEIDDDKPIDNKDDKEDNTNDQNELKANNLVKKILLITGIVCLGLLIISFLIKAKEASK